MTNTNANNIILVPTDFSAVCQNAIDHALKIAEKSHHEIVLLHVINRETKSKLGKDDTSLVVEAKLKDLAEEIAKTSQVKTSYIFREGSIFDVIQEVAKDLNPKFVVLGTHGKKGLQHLFGSFALKVISQSPAPVIVVQEKKYPEGGFSKIVFPIGLHTEARQQVFYAIVTQAFFESEILVFQQNCMDAAEKAKLQIITSQIEDEFRKHGVKYSVVKAEKTTDFAAQLLNFAVVNSADVIMMMTDSVIDNPSFDNSSWSEKLIFNASQIPILCINPVYLGQIHYSL